METIKQEFDRISGLDFSNNQIYDLDKFIGVLDITVDYLNVFSTTILAVISIYFPNPKNKLPDKILKIATGYHKVTNPPFKVLAKNTVQYLDYILATAGDLRAVLIAIAENVYQLSHLAPNAENSQDVLSFSEVVYIPLCHRLGFYRLKSQMENLVLKHRNPEIYSDILKKVEKAAKGKEAFISKFTKPILEGMADHKVHYKIKGRTKSIASIYAKMQKQEIPFEKVYDLFAIRIITQSNIKNEKADCWHVYSVVTNVYKPELSRLRDWISNPKENGYESLHITVKQDDNRFVEVQIRSERMDDEAENGLAAHWRYKGGKSDKQVNEYLKKIRKAIETGSSYGDDLSYESKNFSKDIYAFTPMGELKKLRQGATVLDFAFAIHSEVGVRCSGARINGRQRPIKQKLANGDMVEILTSKNQRPGLDWINFVTSSRAKTRIKKALDERRLNEATEGKEMLVRRLKNWKIEFNQSLLDTLSNHFKYKTITDLYQGIFLGAVGLKEIKKVVLSSMSAEDKADINIESSEPKESKKTTSTDALVVDELNHVNYKLGKCCNPVPGDKIFGFVTVAKGITIHRHICPNAPSMRARYPYRILPAQWKTKEDNENFRAEIFIKGVDKDGVLSEITKIISNHVGLVSININSIGRYFQGKISVLIQNQSQLNTLINSLSSKKEILEVFRVGNKK